MLSNMLAATKLVLSIISSINDTQIAKNPPDVVVFYTHRNIHKRGEFMDKHEHNFLDAQKKSQVSNIYFCQGIAQLKCRRLNQAYVFNQP